MAASYPNPQVVARWKLGCEMVDENWVSWLSAIDRIGEVNGYGNHSLRSHRRWRDCGEFCRCIGMRHRGNAIYGGITRPFTRDGEAENPNDEASEGAEGRAVHSAQAQQADGGCRRRHRSGRVRWPASRCHREHVSCVGCDLLHQLRSPRSSRGYGRAGCHRCTRCKGSAGCCRPSRGRRTSRAFRSHWSPGRKGCSGFERFYGCSRCQGGAGR
jgi:hypothetical protein